MSRGRHSPVPQPTPDERALLEALVRRRQTPRGLATRTRVILLSTDHPEWTLSDIGEKVGLCDDTVSVWRRRFIRAGIDGLSDAPKSGAPRSIQDQQVEQVVRLTLDTLPAHATHWTTRSMARASGLTQSAVHRIWRAFGLRPHVTSSFQLSKDPLLIEDRLRSWDAGECGEAMPPRICVAVVQANWGARLTVRRLTRPATQPQNRPCRRVSFR